MLLLEPGLLEPKTIDDSNFHTIVVKCIQTESWNQKLNDMKLFLLRPFVRNFKCIRWYPKYSFILSDYAQKLIAWRYLVTLPMKLLPFIV